MADPAGLIEAQERVQKERNEAKERREKEKEEARVKMPIKRKESEGLRDTEAASLAWKRAKMARTTGGPKETVSATTTSKSDVQSKVLTEQQEGKEMVGEIQAGFTALEIAAVLAPSSSVPRWQPPKKKTPGVATLPKLKIATTPSSFNVGVPNTPTPAKEVTASVPDKAALTSTPQFTPTPETHNDIGNVTLALERTIRTQSGHETPGMPITRTTFEQRSAMPVLAEGSEQKVPATTAPSVRTAARKQKSLTPGGLSKAHINNKSVPVAYRIKPRTPASDGHQGVTNVSPAVAPIGQLDSDLQELRESSLALPPGVASPTPTSSSAVNIIPGHSSSPFAAPAPALVRCGLFGDRSSTSLFAALATTPNVSSGLFDARPSTSPSVALAPVAVSSGLYGDRPSTSPFKSTAPDTPSSASPGGSGRPSTSPLTLEGAAHDTLFSVSSSGSPASSLGLKDTTVVSSSDAKLGQSNAIASTLSLVKAPPLDVDAGESLPTGAKFTGPFRLSDLPQELQDSIFELAYTEPNFKIVYKSSWEAEQKHVRKSTGKPKVDFPAHKVNEWMVSKKYFRAAAKAWVEAQTSFEFVKSQIGGDSSTPHNRFPPTMLGANEGDGLFLEFGRTFVVDMSSPRRLIEQCPRAQHIIGIVWEDYFDEIDRGLAWDTEFTDEELVSLLKRADITLPSRVEKVHLQSDDLLFYADTDAERAIFNTNVTNLERVLSQHKSKGPQPDAQIDHGCMYLHSAVTRSAPSEVFDSSACTWRVLRSSASTDTNAPYMCSSTDSKDTSPVASAIERIIERLSGTRDSVLDPWKVMCAFYFTLSVIFMCQGKIETALKLAYCGCLAGALCVALYRRL